MYYNLKRIRKAINIVIKKGLNYESKTNTKTNRMAK